MFLRKQTLAQLNEIFKKKRSEYGELFPENKNLLTLYDNVISRLETISKSLATINKNINELAEYSQNVMLRQKANHDFLLKIATQILNYAKEFSQPIDLPLIQADIKTLSLTGLTLNHIPTEQYVVNDFINMAKSIESWMTHENTLRHFYAIDNYISYYEKSLIFFNQFFTNNLDVASLKTLKLAINSNENANDAVMFEKIFNEPLQMPGRIKLFLETMLKQTKNIQQNLLALKEEGFDIQHHKIFSSYELDKTFLDDAINSMQQFSNQLTSIINKITRFNKRQEGMENTAHKTSHISLDLLQSNILFPSQDRKMNYLSYCSYYQEKLDRLISYLDDYETRCGDTIFSKHNQTGKMLSAQIKQFWEERYNKAFLQLQNTLSYSPNFLPKFIDALRDLSHTAIEALSQYDAQGGFSQHSGKSYVMAYILEIKQAISHLESQHDFCPHPEISKQLKLIGPNDDDRMNYYNELIVSAKQEMRL